MSHSDTSVAVRQAINKGSKCHTGIQAINIKQAINQALIEGHNL